MSITIFGWQGFSFEHPSGWAPVTLNGTRASGYVRLSDGDDLSCHVRWITTRREIPLDMHLDRYLGALGVDARKRKVEFNSSADEEDGQLHYRWTAHLQARGTVIQAEDGRVFFVELTGSRKQQLLPLVRPVRASFAVSEPDVPQLWAMMGLRVRVPSEFRLEKADLKTGQSILRLRAKRCTLLVSRHALAAEGMAGKSFEQNIRERFESMASVESLDERRVAVDVHARRSLFLYRAGSLHLHQPEGNQIVTMGWVTMRRTWRPEWAWFD